MPTSTSTKIRQGRVPNCLRSDRLCPVCDLICYFGDFICYLKDLNCCFGDLICYLRDLVCCFGDLIIRGLLGCDYYTITLYSFIGVDVRNEPIVITVPQSEDVPPNW